MAANDIAIFRHRLVSESLGPVIEKLDQLRLRNGGKHRLRAPHQIGLQLDIVLHDDGSIIAAVQKLGKRLEVAAVATMLARQIVPAVAKKKLPLVYIRLVVRPDLRTVHAGYPDDIELQRIGFSRKPFPPDDGAVQVDDIGTDFHKGGTSV